MVSKTDMVKEFLKANPNPSPQEIANKAKEVGCAKSLIYKVLRKMPKPAELKPAGEPIVSAQPEPEMEVPLIEEEVSSEEVVPEEFKEKAEPLEEITAKFEAGLLTSEDLMYVWQSVNNLFPLKHQRPSKSMEILGKLWVKPANRMIEKYATENVDLYLAIGVTILTFAPSLVSMVRERRKPEPKKESEEIIK